MTVSTPLIISIYYGSIGSIILSSVLGWTGFDTFVLIPNILTYPIFIIAAGYIFTGFFAALMAIARYRNRLEASIL